MRVSSRNNAVLVFVRRAAFSPGMQARFAPEQQLVHRKFA